MFTANIAGSAGSHLRSDLPHRDSNPHNSNPNLLEIEGDSYVAASAEEKRYLVNILKPTLYGKCLGKARLFETLLHLNVLAFLIDFIKVFC